MQRKATRPRLGQSVEKCKKKGLNATITSFLLKMVWNILPTEKRLARIYNVNENCKFCLDKRNENIEGNIEHFLIHCPENCRLSEKIMNLIGAFSNIDPRNLITFSIKIQLTNEYPVLWLLANFLMNLWNLKKRNKFNKNELKVQLLANNSMQKKICPGLDFNRTERLIFGTFD